MARRTRGAVTQRTAPRANGMASGLKNARYALLKDAKDLTDRRRKAR